MRNVYYRSLVKWEVVEEIILLAEPHEKAEVTKLMMGSLDHVVMETILHHLDKKHHQEFLEMCAHRYHDETLLDWVKEKAEGVEEAVREAIAQTKASIKKLLE